ncbi:MAG: hypothetical protein JO186_10170 [Actinobacteria bacterium]|nr:hypothetical protein [Actinomycetota bacterium]
MILENGVIRTLDPGLPTARALAVAGDRIAGGVGVHETALASPETIDLGGRVVVPGLNDARVFAGDDPRAALKVAASRGVTAIHALDGLETWAELAASGALTLRVWQILPARAWESLSALGLRPGFGSELLRLGDERPLGDAYASGRTLADVDPLRDGAPLEAITVAPAEVVGDARRRGRLLPGYAADLTVLDASESRVVATMLAGRWTHNPPPW